MNARTCAKVSVLGVRDCWRILHTYQLDAVYDCCSRLGISSYWQDNIYSDWPWSICLLFCDNYVPQWWVEFNNKLSWLFTNRFSATRYMKVKRIFVCTKNGLFIHLIKLVSSFNYSSISKNLILENDPNICWLILKYHWKKNNVFHSKT